MSTTRKAQLEVAAQPPESDPIAAARADLAACVTVEALDALWDALDVEVCRQIGADTFDEMRTKLGA